MKLASLKLTLTRDDCAFAAASVNVFPPSGDLSTSTIPKLASCLPAAWPR